MNILSHLLNCISIDRVKEDKKLYESEIIQIKNLLNSIIIISL